MKSNIEQTRTSSSSRTIFPSVNCQDDVKKIPLSHIYFGPTTKSQYLAAQSFTDLGLLFHPNAYQLSICFNKLKDEIVIPFSEVLKCKLIGEREIIVHLKPNFQRQYYHHLDGTSIKKDDDPTNGLIIGANSLLIKSYHSSEFEFLQKRGFADKTNYNDGKASTVNMCNNKQDRHEEFEERDNMSLRPASINQINRISQPSHSNNNPQGCVVSTRNPQPISNSHFLLPQKRDTVVAITQRVNLNEKTGTKRTYNNYSNKPTANELQLSRVKQDQLPFYQASIRKTPQIQQPQSSEGQFSQIQHQFPKAQYSLLDLSCQPSQQIKISSRQQSQYRINESALNQDSSVKQKQQLYVTCIFAIEKRALYYPKDGTLHNLKYLVKRRFNKYEWTNIWYKNKSKGNENWGRLNSEEDWKVAKNDEKIKSFIRIDLYFR